VRGLRPFERLVESKRSRRDERCEAAPDPVDQSVPFGMSPVHTGEDLPIAPGGSATATPG